MTEINECSEKRCLEIFDKLHDAMEKCFEVHNRLNMKGIAGVSVWVEEWYRVSSLDGLYEQMFVVFIGDIRCRDNVHMMFFLPPTTGVFLYWSTDNLRARPNYRYKKHPWELYDWGEDGDDNSESWNDYYV